MGDPPHSSAPADAKPKPKHIVIIGGGIVGVCTAYYLSLDPDLPSTTTITIVEGTRIAAGASGYAGGFLGRDEDYHTPQTAELSRMSYDLHRGLAEQYGGREKWGYRPLDTYGLAQHVEIDPSKPGNGECPVPWLPHATSWTHRAGTSSTAQANPGPFCEHLSHIFLSRPNTRLLIGTAVSASLSQGRIVGITVQHDEDGREEELQCDSLVLAAGPWLGGVAARLLGESVGNALNVYGAQANSIIIKTKEPLTAHAVVACIQMGGTFHNYNEPEVYCRADGTTYFCGTAGPEPLPPTAHKIPYSPEGLEKLHAEARNLAPVFKEENGATTVREGACYLPRPERGRPLIGKAQGVEGVWVGGGHDVWGITQGPGTGLVLSQMILGGKPSVDVSALAP